MSLLASAHSVGFPSSSLYAFGVLLTGTVRVAYNLLFFGDSAWKRIVVFIASTVIVLIVLGVWVQVLRRGSESFYLRYDWKHVPRPLRVLFPQGWWPETRSFTPVRALSHDKASSFSIAFLLVTLIMAGNAGYNGVDKSICSATYTNTALLHGVLLIIFLVLRPFRIPALNVVWFIARALDIGVNTAAAGWVFAEKPLVTYTDTLATFVLISTAVQTCFNGLVFVALLLERLFRVQLQVQAMRTETARKVEEKEVDKELAVAQAAFDGATQRKAENQHGPLASDEFASLSLGGVSSSFARLIAGTSGDQGTRSLRLGRDDMDGSAVDVSPSPRRSTAWNRGMMTPPLPIRQISPDRPLGGSPNGSGHSPRHSRSPPALANASASHSPRRAVSALPLTAPCVLQLRPVPEGFGENQLMHLLLVFDPLDVEFVGASAFVKLRTRAAGLNAVAAFDGRLLMGTAVECFIVGDDL
jgi:hypothetical protein